MEHSKYFQQAIDEMMTGYSPEFREKSRFGKGIEEEAPKKSRGQGLDEQSLTARANEAIPPKFDKGKDGRILFDHHSEEIVVVMHICFYGFGFDDLYKACKACTFDTMVKTPSIKSWLVDKHNAIIEQIRAVKKDSKLDDDLRASFRKDLVDEQCRYLAKMLNEFSHTALGPDGNKRSVRFEIDGEYVSEEIAKQYMIDNTLKLGDGKYKPANNALFFVRVEAVDITPHNSSMKGLIGRNPTTPDNSIFISTLHLSATPFTHELIVHPFWGRGIKGSPEHLVVDWSNNPKGYETIPSIRFVEYDPERVGNNNPKDEIKGLPSALKIPGTNRLDKEKRKVLPPDIVLSNIGSPIAWDKSKGRAWVGDATNTFFNYDKKNKFVLFQEQYDAGQEINEAPSKREPDKLKIERVLWSLLLWCSLTVCLSSCKISECRKAEEAEYASYRYSLANDSIRNDSNKNEIIRSKTWYLSFDCKHHYTKKYIRKHLGKPLRIYISDKNNPNPALYDYDKPFCYEDWLYPVSFEYPPNEKPFIDALLVIRFEPNKPIMMKFDCPRDDVSYPCRGYKVINDPEKDVDWIFNLINTDSFDLKCPYILKNEQKFYWTF